MLALLLGSSARTGHAQPSQPVVQYRAPAGCPDQAFFTERMRARLRADGVRARPGAQLEVRVELAASGAKGSVRIRQAANSAQRSLEAGSCKEVVEGLALIAALAIATPRKSTAGAAHVRTDARTPVAADSPDAPKHGAAGQASRPPVETESSGKGSSAREVAAAPAEADSSGKGSSAREVAALTQGVGTDRPGAETAAPVASDASEPSEVEAPAGSEPRLRGLLIDAGFIAIHGPAPDVRPGLQLGAAVVLASGVLDWRLGLAGRLALPETTSSAEGTTHFGFVAGVVELCAAGALGSVWSWHGCAVVEPGVLRAGAENTRNPRDYRRAWLALGAGAGLAWRLGEWLGLRAGAESLVPTRRDRALLAGDVVHHVPPVCLRLELGLEARAW